MRAITEIRPEVLHPLLHQALRHWHKTDWGSHDASLAEHLSAITLAQESKSPSSLQAVIEEGLVSLAAIEPRSEHIIRWRFLERQTIQFVANQLGLSIDSANREQRKAILDLAVVLAERENKLRTEKVSDIEANLPPSTYSHLFGHQTVQDQLITMLLQKEAPWLMTVAGLGGIGKTAVADAVVRQILPHFRFQQIIWLRIEDRSMHGRTLSPEHTWEQILGGLRQWLQLPAQPMTGSQLESQIRQKLKSGPYLIIIDNIENEADATHLFMRFSDWGNPSKFILTSRVRPVSQQTVLVYSLNELTQSESLKLLRHEAAQRGITDFETANDAQLMPIYKLTGGHPLALKLTVGLTAVMPLPAILKDFTHSQSGPIEQMYKHIYWKNWQSLSEEAHILLEAMPLVGKAGAKPEQMQAISQLNEDQLWAAIRELVARAMLEVRGTAWDRRYGIHHLTESFLQTEIINWPEKPSSS